MLRGTLIIIHVLLSCLVFLYLRRLYLSPQPRLTEEYCSTPASRTSTSLATTVSDSSSTTSAPPSAHIPGSILDLHMPWSELSLPPVSSHSILHVCTGRDPLALDGECAFLKAPAESQKSFRTPAEVGTRWVFAYGANMGSVKLHRLKIDPLESLPAVLPDHALTMDAVVPGAPDSDPVFAGVIEKANSCGVGVIHLVDDEAFEVLSKSERNYHIVNRTVHTEEDLVSDVSVFIPSTRFSFSMAPGGIQRDTVDASTRYKTLILCGLDEWDVDSLCPGYYEKLAAAFGMPGGVCRSVCDQCGVIPFDAQNRLKAVREDMQKCQQDSDQSGDPEYV
mmetsp:Transcript_18789/g.29330  ORF Transcript_18789/g.29330 Transcript_18789/m.29330 type:complete len:335 (-) Transcript_18789:70-1074(-)